MRIHLVAAGVIASLCVFSASANDGFYQGSGAALVSVVNSGVRVKREMLDLTPLAVPKCLEIVVPKLASD